MKNCDENKELWHSQYWKVNSLYGWAMLQKLVVNNIVWIKDTSQFNKDIIKNLIEKSDEGNIFEVNVQYFDKLHEVHNDLPFLKRLKKSKSLYLIYMIKLNML